MSLGARALFYARGCRIPLSSLHSHLCLVLASLRASWRYMPDLFNSTFPRSLFCSAFFLGLFFYYTRPFDRSLCPRSFRVTSTAGLWDSRLVSSGRCLGCRLRRQWCFLVSPASTCRGPFVYSPRRSLPSISGEHRSVTLPCDSGHRAGRILLLLSGISSPPDFYVVSRPLCRPDLNRASARECSGASKAVHSRPRCAPSSEGKPERPGALEAYELGLGEPIRFPRAWLRPGRSA